MKPTQPPTLASKGKWVHFSDLSDAFNVAGLFWVSSDGKKSGMVGVTLEPQPFDSFFFIPAKEAATKANDASESKPPRPWWAFWR